MIGVAGGVVAWLSGVLSGVLSLLVKFLRGVFSERNCKPNPCNVFEQVCSRRNGSNLLCAVLPSSVSYAERSCTRSLSFYAGTGRVWECTVGGNIPLLSTRVFVRRGVGRGVGGLIFIFSICDCYFFIWDPVNSQKWLVCPRKAGEPRRTRGHT